MKIHKLKLLEEYAIAKLKGIKPFEIRLDDRDFNENDIVVYTCPDNEDLNYELSGKIYIIDYITDYAQKDGYVVFSDRLIDG